MTTKDFIAIADGIKKHNAHQLELPEFGRQPFTITQIHAIADVLYASNPKFDRFIWLNYIAGKVGPNGGKL